MSKDDNNYGDLEKQPATVGVTADMDLAQSLSYFELVFALNDAKILKKEVIANRLRKLAAREDISLGERVRQVLKFNADALDGSEDAE